MIDMEDQSMASISGRGLKNTKEETASEAECPFGVPSSSVFSYTNMSSVANFQDWSEQSTGTHSFIVQLSADSKEGNLHCSGFPGCHSIEIPTSKDETNDTHRTTGITQSLIHMAAPVEHSDSNVSSTEPLNQSTSSVSQSNSLLGSPLMEDVTLSCNTQPVEEHKTAYMNHSSDINAGVDNCSKQRDIPNPKHENQPRQESVATADVTPHTSEDHKPDDSKKRKNPRRAAAKKAVYASVESEDPMLTQSGVPADTKTAKGKAAPRGGRNKNGSNPKRKKKEVDDGDSDKDIGPQSKKFKKKDFIRDTLHMLTMCKLNTPIPEEIFSVITDNYVSISGSLEDHVTDSYCCDTDILSVEELKKEMGASDNIFVSKCHLSVNEEGIPCWCCCYIDFFGDFEQKKFVTDVLGFELAEQLAERSRENAEISFHMLWIQQNKDHLNFDIPDNASKLVLERLIQIKDILMRIDDIGLLVGEMRRVIQQ
uniref:Uncharacterized protein n=1 Tax=Babesia bovis TaxID=5865 RepID=S6BK02_BABBO|nr:hypothetical protein [Babesia bovis]